MVRDLLTAKEALRERGFCKRMLFDSCGRVCAHGALVVAEFGDPERRGGELSARERQAAAVMMELLDLDIGLGDWNDAKDRTQADIEDAFDDAASMAMSEAVSP